MSNKWDETSGLPTTAMGDSYLSYTRVTSCYRMHIAVSQSGFKPMYDPHKVWLLRVRYYPTCFNKIDGWLYVANIRPMNFMFVW